MTGEIFLDIVNKLNKQMVIQNRFIILFVDNCKAHPAIGYCFSNVKICFLPKNSTSLLQPMDAGVIKCFKGNYRVKLCRKIISQLEADYFV